MQTNKTKVFRFDRGGREVRVIGSHIVSLIAAEGAKLKGVEKVGNLL